VTLNVDPRAIVVPGDGAVATLSDGRCGRAEFVADGRLTVQELGGGDSQGWWTEIY